MLLGLASGMETLCSQVSHTLPTIWLCCRLPLHEASGIFQSWTKITRVSMLHRRMEQETSWP